MAKTMPRMILTLVAFSALAMPVLADPLLDRVIERERSSTYLGCTALQFLPQAFYVGDISKDGENDVIVNAGAVACDKVVGSDCNAFGCPYRIYTQTDNGKIAYVGQMRALSYEIRYLYGIRNITFKIKGKRCHKTGSNTCELVTRVDGRELITLSTN